MRSAVLVILCAILLGGLFILYWVSQPAGPALSSVAGGTPMPPTLRRKDPEEFDRIRSGREAWLKEFDGNRQLSSEFTGDEYHPRPNGTVDVTHPVARFFLANHQRIEVRGVTGNVVLRDAPNPADGLEAAPMSPPTRGRLDDVTVTLFDETRPPGDRKVLVMRTNNMVFDNETFRISTEGYRDAQGRQIADDQVPVHVTGDIILEGRGLTVRWNDRDGRLELLEIAHGEMLEIPDPGKLSPSGSGGSKESPSLLGQIGAPLRQMLAAADDGAAGDVITSYRPPDTQPHSGRSGRSSHGTGAPVIYLARFFDNVRINQPDPSGKFDQLRIDPVGRMDVNFLLKQSSNEPTTRSSSTTTQAAAEPTPATAEPTQTTAERSSTDAGQPSAVSPHSASAATSRPVAKEPPVFVHWTGILRITPLRGPPPVALRPGDSVVQLYPPAHSAEPVVIRRVEPHDQGYDLIHCASAQYATSGQRAWLYRSAEFPRTLIDKYPAPSAKDQRLTRVISEGIVHYSRGEHLAELNGPGTANVPLESQNPADHAVMNVAWDRLARFDFTEADRQQEIHSGHFEGNVAVDHPRMKLRSRSLDLQFDSSEEDRGKHSAESPREKSSSQSNLTQATASGDVRCDLLDSGGKKQSIDSDQLVLDTDRFQGRMYARHVHAVGSVHARGEDDLRADDLDVWLRPSAEQSRPQTRPSSVTSADPDSVQAELDMMDARGKVVATSKDGSVATGDELLVTTVDGKQETVLTGTRATVTDPRKNRVVGPRIKFDSADGQAYVIGTGSLHAIQQASATQPAQPVDVTWAKGAHFDGGANRIDAEGGVFVRSLDRRGFVDTATGERIRVDLRRKIGAPTTRPARASASTRPAVASDGMQMNLFGDKEVVAFTLIDNAVMESTLSTPIGAVLQQMELKGPRIIARQIDPDGNPIRSVTVPAAGAMLVRDYQPASRTPQQPAGDETGGARGQNAFQWHRSLVYTEATNRADMVGRVRVVHYDADTSQPALNLDADHVIAFFAARDPAAPRRPESDSPQMQLKYLTALADPENLVVVTHGINEMRARQVDYDPARHLLIATGTSDEPATFYEAGRRVTVARTMEWDTITWNPQMRDAIVDLRPLTPGAPPPKPKTPRPDAARRSNP